MHQELVNQKSIKILLQVIKIHFVSFDLEYSTNCLYDNVAIYDGINNKSPLVDTYCGGHLPENFKSSGRYVYITFKSDSSVQRKGFKASYSTETAPLCEQNVYFLFIIRYLNVPSKEYSWISNLKTSDIYKINGSLFRSALTTLQNAWC